MESSIESGVDADQACLSNILSLTEFDFDLVKAAVEVESVNIIASLLRHHMIDINRCDDKGWTLLQTAVDNGCQRAVATLIKYGANVNSNGTHEDTMHPIHIACWKGSSEIVRTLLDSGSNVDIRHCCGNFIFTPLVYAIFQQHVDVVELLLRHSADVNALVVGKNIIHTALHVAVEVGSKSIVELLVNNGADCNARMLPINEKTDESAAVEDNCKTPLSCAISNGYTDIALFLTKRGADVNVIVDKCTMLFSAIVNCGRDCHQLVQSLISHGADVNAKSYIDATESIGPYAGPETDVSNSIYIDKTALTEACKLGYENTVETLLDSGACVNDTNCFGNTPLNDAIANHRIVEMLVSRGADVNRGVHDCGPLVESIIEGHIETTRVLLHHKAQVNFVKPPYQSPILCACLTGNYDAVELLLEHGANVNEIIKDAGTPLYMAANKGHSDLVRLLVKRGADINTGMSERSTPLSVAVNNGYTEVVQILLESKPTYGVFDMCCAAGNGYSKILAMLFANLDQNTLINDELLHELIPSAVESNDIETIEFLLKLSSNIHIPDEFNKFSNVVFKIVSKGQTEVLKLFIDREVNVNVRNTDGQTLLILAAINGYFETVQLLVESGADVFAIDNDGMSALQHAEANGHSKVTNFLTHCSKKNATSRLTTSNISLFDVHDIREAVKLLSKQDVDVENCDGLRPLHFAARRGLVDIAQLLIDFGATVDATDSAGNTPLHEAARQGLEITELLVKHTKQLNFQNVKGSTPLHEAMQTRNFDVALFLIENGADSEVADNWMNTPFHYTWFQDLLEASSVSSCHGSLIRHLSNCVQRNIMGISVLSRLTCYNSHLNSCDKKCIASIQKHDCSDVDMLGNTELHRVVGVYQASKLSPLCADRGQALDVLLKSPEVNLNAQNVFGQTPLHVTQDMSAVKACLEYGREEVLRAIDSCGRNYWHLLANRNDVEQIVRLIEQLVPNVANTGIEATDEFGRTPLHYAVMYMNSDWYVKWLIENASNCENIQDCDGKKPVHYMEYILQNSVVKDEVAVQLAHTSNALDIHVTASLIENIECFNLTRLARTVLGYGRSTKKAAAKKLQTSHFEQSSSLVSSQLSEILKCFKINRPDELILNFHPRGIADFIMDLYLAHRYPYSQGQESSTLKGSRQNLENGSLSAVRHNDQCNHSDGMFEFITQIISDFMFELVKQVGETDPRFRGRLLSAGSVYEGTKVDFCDEFDFIVLLERFSELVTVYESPNSPPGFVMLKMGDNTHMQFTEFSENDFILNTRLVKFRFEALVKQVLNSASFQKKHDRLHVLDTIRGEKVIYMFSPDRLATNIRVRFTKLINGQHVFHDVSIDVVPAIYKENYWPTDAEQKIDELMGKFYKSVPRQCYLVFEQPQKKHPWVGWKAPHARVDFSVLESNIIRRCHPVVRAACVVVKEIVKNFCDFKFFKSYVIKAALMHSIIASDDVLQSITVGLSDNYVVSTDDEEFQSQLALLVQKIMRRLLCFVLQDFVPSVFMPSFVLPVCSFEPHVKFSHMKLHRGGISSFRDLIDTTLMSSGDISTILIDSQLEHITKAFIITHLMYWSVQPTEFPRKIYFPPINPLYEADYWSSIEKDEMLIC